MTLTILPSGSLVDVLQSSVYFGTIEANEIVGQEGVQLYINGNAINGSVLNINANLSNSNGYGHDFMFNLNVGHATVVDPLGLMNMGIMFMIQIRL